MKKQWLIVFVLAGLLALAGCDPGQGMIEGEELRSNTVKIELYQYENPSPESIREGGTVTPVFDFDKATLLGTLDESSFENLINDIAGYHTLLFGRVLNEPIGKTLVLYQSDGNMVVLYGCIYQNAGITKYYGECNIYDSNGIFVSNLGDINHDFVEELEAKYFKD